MHYHLWPGRSSALGATGSDAALDRAASDLLSWVNRALPGADGSGSQGVEGKDSRSRPGTFALDGVKRPCSKAL